MWSCPLWLAQTATIYVRASPSCTDFEVVASAVGAASTCPLDASSADLRFVSVRLCTGGDILKDTTATTTSLTGQFPKSRTRARNISVSTRAVLIHYSYSLNVSPPRFFSPDLMIRLQVCSCMGLSYSWSQTSCLFLMCAAASACRYCGCDTRLLRNGEG